VIPQMLSIKGLDSVREAESSIKSQYLTNVSNSCSKTEIADTLSYQGYPVAHAKHLSVNKTTQ